MEKLKEKCAVFGVYGKKLDAARLTYFGLFALQHRGQETSGISSSTGKRIYTHKAAGLVTQVYTEKNLDALPGHMAIGHNRYSTSGGTNDCHTQPVAHLNDSLSLAHNGNLPEVKKLRAFCKANNIPHENLNDSELMHAVIKYHLHKGMTLEDAITTSFPLFTGAFCLLVMTRDKVAAIRDSNGIRPLSIGTLQDGFVFSSETCALDTVSATFLRDVNPGELVVIDKKGLHSYPLAKPDQKLDIFEFVYFARPDSMLLGKNVYEVRKNLGKNLAKECPIDADVVIPVPDSSIPAAIGYAETSGIPFEFGLTKNRYIGRTFIMPDQRLREKSVQMKLNPIGELIKGKRIILLDDSIVRGTTAQKLVKFMRVTGAREVHLMSSCPPVLFPDYYGINTPSQQELIASRMTLPKMKIYFGVDSLSFLSYEGLIRATGLPESLFCTSCFTGEYPIDIGHFKKKLHYPVPFLFHKHSNENTSRAYL